MLFIFYVSTAKAVLLAYPQNPFFYCKMYYFEDFINEKPPYRYTFSISLSLEGFPYE